MRLLSSVLVVSILVLVVPLTARAQSADEAPKKHSSWYGGQVILADVGSLALGFGGVGIAGATKGNARLCDPPWA